MGRNTLTFHKKAYYREYNKQYYANPVNLQRRRDDQNARRRAKPELAMLNRAIKVYGRRRKVGEDVGRNALILNREKLRNELQYIFRSAYSYLGARNLEQQVDEYFEKVVNICKES